MAFALLVILLLDWHVHNALGCTLAVVGDVRNVDYIVAARPLLVEVADPGLCGACRVHGSTMHPRALLVKSARGTHIQRQHIIGQRRNP